MLKRPQIDRGVASLLFKTEHAQAMSKHTDLTGMNDCSRLNALSDKGTVTVFRHWYLELNGLFCSWHAK